MFLIVSTYESDNHTQKKIYWGKCNRYCICDMLHAPTNDWLIDYSIGDKKHADKKLERIPQAIFLDGRNHYIKNKHLIEFNWRDL